MYFRATITPGTTLPAGIVGWEIHGEAGRGLFFLNNLQLSCFWKLKFYLIPIFFKKNLMLLLVVLTGLGMIQGCIALLRFIFNRTSRKTKNKTKGKGKKIFLIISHSEFIKMEQKILKQIFLEQIVGTILFS